MRRLAAIVAVAAACGVLLTAVGFPRKPGDAAPATYRVRAIFDNASAAAEGEDVKVAGAKVGEIESLDVTPDRKAAVVLAITDARFAPFHTDARCKLRPEGLLAVKFVECDPGTSGRPLLRVAGEGEGAGQALLPVQRTSSAVDLDLVNNIYRRPTGQQLAIFLSELGSGLAGRGSDLNEVIHRANPALGQTNRVLRILAAQSERLERFERDAEALLRPLARDRRAIADFIVAANRTSRSSALRATDVRRSIDRLPAFLAALRLEMQRLHAFSDQAVPLLDDLGEAAPGLGRMTGKTPGFSRAAIPATRDLGATSERITPPLLSTLPLLRRLKALGADARIPSRDLAELLTSFDDQRGPQRLLELAYHGAGAVNGFDELGHYARVEALTGACSQYTAKGYFGCDAQWGPAATSATPVNQGPRGRLTPITGADEERTEVPPSDSPDSVGSTLLDFLLGE